MKQQGRSIKTRWQLAIAYLCIAILSGCDESPLNSPYPHLDPSKKTLFTSFAERPKTLDPAKAYSSNEYTFIGQIYEPPLTYHSLKRPYQLEPQTLTAMPTVRYYNEHGREVQAQSEAIAKTVYTFSLQPGIYYQPHPAFAKSPQGHYRYHQMTDAYLDANDINTLQDFKYVDTRELNAADYVYQIKRLADPNTHSPIASLMAGYIVDFAAFSKRLKQQRTHQHDNDLRNMPFDGATVIDDYHYQISIKGIYPQFPYWLAMPFFAPMPWEADVFYHQPGMRDRNISLDWYPIGTGAFMLTENNPNRQMVLIKNPHYHPAYFPTTGSAKDKAKGYLANAGKKLPLINKIIFTLEKESIPRWNKFLQGYYDTSGISADSFDQAISVDQKGQPMLTAAMEEKGIQLQSSVEPSIFYMGFNMLDEIVGGNTTKARKLRQAISIAINYEEYISIFLNGRGLVAQGPIPPGITGYQQGKAGLNPYVYDWSAEGARRKPLSHAKQLLAEAGYPNGRDSETGKPLILNFDTPAGSGPEEKAYFSWLRKQFAQLGIALNVRATQYNRFQEKMRTGKAQIFTWGWNADYPDPENFLFLFLSKNGKVKHGGENASNYTNPVFDNLFNQMRLLPEGNERRTLITKMVRLLQQDAPWVWGMHPKQFVLQQAWVSPTKPDPIGRSTLRYVDIDGAMRAKAQRRWNQPVVWPLIVLMGLIVLSLLPVLMIYYRRCHRPRRLIKPINSQSKD